MWKNCFPQRFQEIVHFDERTGEKHIADVKTDNGFIVEVQHSPIPEGERRSREDFYGDMLWIVDARDLHGWFTVGTSFDLATCDPMTYYFQWRSRSTLLKRWSETRKPVFFDTLFPSPLTGHVMTPSQEHVLWRLVQFDPDTNLGFIAPVRSDWLIQAILNGDPLPVMRCDEEDAWRYRRQLHEVRSRSTATGQQSS